MVDAVEVNFFEIRVPSKCLLETPDPSADGISYCDVVDDGHDVFHIAGHVSAA
jgi:hypothetical protein